MKLNCILGPVVQPNRVGGNKWTTNQHTREQRQQKNDNTIHFAHAVVSELRCARKKEVGITDK